MTPIVLAMAPGFGANAPDQETDCASEVLAILLEARLWPLVPRVLTIIRTPVGPRRPALREPTTTCLEVLVPPHPPPATMMIHALKIPMDMTPIEDGEVIPMAEAMCLQTNQGRMVLEAADGDASERAEP